jgi:hexosaminidase
MDHYGDSEANPTPPAAGLPPQLVIEQWLSPVWNWANVSAITGDSYASTSDPWPKGHRGFRALVTDGWYLDSSAGGPAAWEEPYAKEPLTNKTCTYDAAHPQGNCTCTCPEHNYRDGLCHCFDLRYSEKASMVLGGEACLWGERTDAGVVQQRAFPGAMAVAERLWSRMELTNATRAAPRIERQRCRMLERGIDMSPNQPGYCI